MRTCAKIKKNNGLHCHSLFSFRKTKMKTLKKWFLFTLTLLIRELWTTWKIVLIPNLDVFYHNPNSQWIQMNFVRSNDVKSFIFCKIYVTYVKCSSLSTSFLFFVVLDRFVGFHNQYSWGERMSRYLCAFICNNYLLWSTWRCSMSVIKYEVLCRK